MFSLSGALSSRLTVASRRRVDLRVCEERAANALQVADAKLLRGLVHGEVRECLRQAPAEHRSGVVVELFVLAAKQRLEAGPALRPVRARWQLQHLRTHERHLVLRRCREGRQYAAATDHLRTTQLT